MALSTFSPQSRALSNEFLGVFFTATQCVILAQGATLERGKPTISYRSERACHETPLQGWERWWNIRPQGCTLG